MEYKKYCTDFEVRFYECDVQGIVNNANYLNYLEHSRMNIAKEIGISIVGLTHQNIIWVVNEINIKYHASLKPLDLFYVETTIEKKGIMRIIFNQQIIRRSDKQVVVNAQIITACIINGRPSPFPENISQLFS